MRPSLSLLFLTEMLALLGSIVLALVFVLDDSDPHELKPITAEALSIGPSQERWFGIFLEDNHVGFSVSRSSPALVAEGSDEQGTLYEQRSSFRLPVSGTIQEVVTASAALVDGQSQLVRFDFFMASNLVKISARGEVLGDEISMEVTQAGEITTLSFPIESPPHVGVSLEAVIQGEELTVGNQYEVPFFDPLTMAEGTMLMIVEDVEVLVNGEEAYWVSTNFMGAASRTLFTSAGEVIREEGAIGLSMHRMTAAEAQAIPKLDDSIDLISLAAAPLTGRLRKPRKAKIMEVIVEGVELEGLIHQPPSQQIDGDRIRVQKTDLASLPELPVSDHSEPKWISPTWTLPVGHEEIRARSDEVIGDASNRQEAVARLVDFVDIHVANIPTIGVPHGLEVLRSAQGDCNEHTALFVSLARAAGIPTRIVAGLVYSERAGTRPAFYYHAWAEVRLGGDVDWVAVDPTFGQFPADATHIKLVEGDLDRQVEIMAYMGRIHFELVHVE